MSWVCKMGSTLSRCSEFFAKLESHRVVKGTWIRERLRKVGGLLGKVEEAVFGASTRCCEKMEDFYRKWEQEIFHSLVHVCVCVVVGIWSFVYVSVFLVVRFCQDGWFCFVVRFLSFLFFVFHCSILPVFCTSLRTYHFF